MKPWLPTPNERRGAVASGSSTGIRLAAEAGMEGWKFNVGAKTTKVREEIYSFRLEFYDSYKRVSSGEIANLEIRRQSPGS